MKHWHATIQVATAIASQDDWQCQTIKLSLPQLNICAGAIINASICVDPTVDGKLMLRLCRLFLTVCDAGKWGRHCEQIIYNRQM
jgi:hypothetical protein